MKGILQERSRGVQTAVAAAAAVAAACVVLWPMVFTDKVPAFGDNVSFWAPNAHFMAASIKSGRLPMWNPYVLGGVPYAADVNHGLFYPPHWIVLSLGLASGLKALIVAHLALAVFGFYLFLERQGIAKPAALWGAAAFGFSQGTLSLANHVVMLESMSYLGLVLYLAARAVDGGGFKPAILAGVAMALSALAGDVHATYITGLAVGALVGVKCIEKAARREFTSSGKAAALGALIALTAAAAASVAILPGIQLAELTNRAAGAQSYAGQNSLDLRSFAGVLAPQLWGAPGSGTVWNFRWNNCVYLGTIILGLAGYALRKPLRDSVAAVFVLLGVGLALGPSSPLWELAYAVMPGFRMFRQPREYFIIATAGAIALAARGLGDMMEPPRKPRRTPWRHVLAAGGIVFVLGITGIVLRGTLAVKLGGWIAPRVSAGATAVAARIVSSAAQALIVAGLATAAVSIRKMGMLPARSAAAVLAVAALADYWVAVGGAVPYGPRALYEGQTEVAERVQAGRRPGEVRIAATGEDFGQYFERFAGRKITGDLPREDKTFAGLMAVKRSLVDNESMYEGLRNVLGYSTFLTRRYAALYEIAAGAKATPVRPRAAAGADYRLLGAEAVTSGVGGEVVEFLNAAPAFRIVYVWNSVPDFDSAREAVAAARSGAMAVPVVEGLGAMPNKDLPQEVLYSVENVWQGDDVATLRVVTDEPGVLLVSQCNYRGWHAYDNKAEIPIYYANLAFQALYLDPGKHELELRFSPSIVKWGAAMTIASLVAALSALLINRGAGKDET